MKSTTQNSKEKSSLFEAVDFIDPIKRTLGDFLYYDMQRMFQYVRKKVIVKFSSRCRNTRFFYKKLVYKKLDQSSQKP